MKKTKVMVTGAGGFLGSYIVRELLKSDQYEVFSFSRSRYPVLEKLGVEQRFGDLKNYSDVRKALEGIDAVIHTASLVGMWGRFIDFYNTNVLGTENILRAMKELGIKKLVYTSTPSVVFEKEDLCGVDENTPYAQNPLTHYARTKIMAEKKVLKNKDIYALALRPHLIFGPGDTNLIPRVIEAQKKNRLKIIGDGENKVDVIYVENAARAHVLALLKVGPMLHGRAYFVGQGPVKLWDFTNDILKRAGLSPVTKKISVKKAYCIGLLIESLLKLAGKFDVHPPMTRFVALQLGKSHYFNHHNLEHDLGFKPEISIEEGLNRLFKNQDHQ